MRPLLPLAAVLAATVLIYWPGIHGPFLLDDFPNIVTNAQLHIHKLNYSSLMGAAFSSDAGPLHRPISMMTFALDEYFFGPGAESMKVTNIFIHAVNGLFLYAAAVLILTAYRRRYRPDLSHGLLYGSALAITAAWLLLPINLTAVLYVVQRMTSLSGAFVLAGIALYLWGRLRMLEGQTGLWMLWLGIALFGALSVLAKESGALLPVYTLVIELTLFGFKRASGERDARLYALYALLLVAPGVLGLIWLWPGIAASFAHSGRPFTMTERLLTEPRVFFDYIYWSLAPNLNTLTLYHDHYPVSKGLLSPASTLASILGLIGLLAVAIWQRQRRPLVALGIFWFLAGQLMTGTIFDLELIFEQRNYLPDFGLLLAVFGTVLLEPPVEKLVFARRTLVIALIALYALILGLRVQEWSNGLTLASMQAELHPHSPRATYALGRILGAAAIDNPHNEKLINAATTALERSANLPGSNLLADQALLILYAQIKKPLQHAWWKRIDQKLRTQPMSAQNLVSLQYLVQCEISRHCRFPNAEMHQAFAIALKRFPDNAKLITLDANWLLNVRGDPMAARNAMLRCVKLSPHSAQYWINLIKLDIGLYRFPEVDAEMRKLQSLNRIGQLNNTIHALQQRLKAAELDFQKRLEKVRQANAHSTRG